MSAVARENVEQDGALVAEKTWTKPRPNIDADGEEFWAGLTQHELLLWTCSECGRQYWPKAFCIDHENEPFAAQMSWQPSSGRGRIFAMNRHHWAFHPGFKEDVPYVYALVELDEGPLISSTLVGDAIPEDLMAVGTPVEIVYEDHPEQGFTLPRFRVVPE